MEILNKVCKKSIEYFDKYMDIKFDKNCNEILVNDKFDYELYSLIELSGDETGIIYMGINHLLAIKIVKYFIGNEDETLKYEALAETLNIIVGLILAELNVVKQGGTIKISPPFNNIEDKFNNKHIKLTKFDYNLSIGYIRR